MKGKMYKLTGTGLFGKAPRGKFKPGKELVPGRKPEASIVRRSGLSLPDKKGK